MRRLIVPLASLVFTYLFFFEYLPPAERVHIPYDLEGFHYPLMDYGFQAVQHGRFPLWDPTIYCGLPYAANPQAAFFYPATWISFAIDWGREHLRYVTLQALVIAHVWAAFLLCFCWFRWRGWDAAACALGAGVFAFGGYTMLQLQHPGYIGAYTWIPLGCWGIDQARASGSWRPLWKLALASALGFLAGHPPTWIACVVAMTGYAVGRRVFLKAVGAIAVSLALAAVQLIPMLEPARMKVPEVGYSGGYRELAFYISYFVPNYFDFGIAVPGFTNPGKEYLYLGVAFVVGAIALLFFRRLREAAPFALAGAIGLVFLANPLNVVSAIVWKSAFLSQIIRDWCFLAAIPVAAAGVTAIGWDALLRVRKPVRELLAGAAIVALVAWSAHLLWIRFHVHWDFAAGSGALIAPAVLMVLLAASAFALPRASRLRSALIVALLVTVAIDYKVYGTRKRVNAVPGRVATPVSTRVLNAFPLDAALELREHPESRVLLDRTVLPVFLRFSGLRTPQGFDPLFPAQMKDAIAGPAEMQSNWMFGVDPSREETLRFFGVRYYIASEPITGERWRRIGSDQDFYKLYEHAGAFQPERFEGGTFERISWTAEKRDYRVRSATGGRFVSGEQYFPSWTATIDGRSVDVMRAEQMFAAVEVPAGDHVVQFRYSARTILWGAAVSVLTIAIGVTVRLIARNKSALV